MKLRTTLPALAAVMLTVACTSPAVEPPGLTGSPTATTSAPTPTPTPDPVLQPSDPELGIVFENVPAGLTGQEVDVYNTVAAYQKEYWRMLTTNIVSPGFDVLASPEIQDMMQGIAALNVEQQARTDGIFRTTISDVVVDGESATAMVCDDFREVIPSDPNGTYTPAEVGLDNLAKQLVLGPSGSGTWMALDSIPAGLC